VNVALWCFELMRAFEILTFGARAVVIGPTSLDAAWLLPALFEAVTRTRIFAPLSAADVKYEWLIAPTIFEQVGPQRCHW